MNGLRFDVLGDHPLRITGKVVAVKATPQFLVIASSQARGDSDHDRSSRFPRRKQHRVSVFERSTLRRVAEYRLAWRAHSLLIDPEGIYALIATGEYDGGYVYSGTLYVLDLRTHDLHEGVDDRREYRDLAWISPGRASLTASPHTDPERHRTGWRAMAVSVPPVWPADPRFRLSLEDCGPQFLDADYRSKHAREALADLPILNTREFREANAITSVATTRSGFTVASSPGVIVEAWDARGERLWRLEGQTSSGHVSASGDRVIALSHGGFRDGRWNPADETVRAYLIDKAGNLASPPRIVGACRMPAFHSANAGQVLVVAESGSAGEGKARPAWLVDMAGHVVTASLPAEYQQYFQFAAARGPQYVLAVSASARVPVAEHATADATPMFIEVSPGGSINELIPISPRTEQTRAHRSAFGMLNADHTLLVHTLHTWQPHRHELLARELPGGKVRWAMELGERCVALCNWDGVLMVCDAAGVLRAIEPDQGEVLWTATVMWNNEHAEVTAMDAAGDWLVLGLYDGVVLRTRRQWLAETSSVQGK